MGRSKIQTIGLHATFEGPLRFFKLNERRRRLQHNWNQSFRDLTFPIRIFISRLLLRLSALCAVYAVKIAPEIRGN